MERDFLLGLGIDSQAAASVLSESERELADLRRQCGDTEKELADLRYDCAVRDAAKDIRFSSKAAERDFIAQLKLSGLEVKDGSLDGFQDFLKQQMDLDPGAFAPDRPVPQFVAPVGAGYAGPAAPANVLQAKEMGARRAAAMRASGDVLKNFL